MGDDALEKALYQLQINPVTFIVNDYRNHFDVFSRCFKILEGNLETDTVRRCILNATRNFKTYRSYLRHLAEQLCTISSYTEALDHLSIELMEELISIQTEDDLERLRKIIEHYKPRFEGFFL